LNFEFWIFIAIIVVMLIVIAISKRESIKEKEKSIYDDDGFLNPETFPIALTDHARERMRERLGIKSEKKMEKLAHNAYKYGTSARLAGKTLSKEILRIQAKNENSVVLIYQGTVFIFSKENVLITVYKMD